jgi:glutamate synthase (NADPH/NADH) small chain
MRDGGQTGCVIRDREIYGERYREGRRLAPETILAEARRCRACETPACRDACPAQIDIPGFIGSFVAGDLEQSYAILKARNTLPEICARVCPTEIQCEGACIEHILGGKPVPVRDIQLHVAQQARKRGIATARLGPASTRRMAVIGAGPAGIACAARLLQDGHAVDLYDTAEGAGGTPLSAIPAYRLAGGEALAEIESLFAEAIDKKRLTRRYGEGVSQEQPLAAFAKKYDAVFLGIGLSEELHLPGALPDTPGVIGAMTFLRTAKSETIFPVPDTVCVIGGGNTAIDAAITAKQNEARDVSILYRRSFAEMPAWPAERSRALDAGIQFLILTQPVGYVIENNALAGIRAARTILGEPDASGRRKAVCLPDSEAVIPAQLAIEALGQAPAVNFHRLAPELRLTSTGLVAVNETTMETSLPRVFAGGDLVNGGTTAVQAIAEGLRAADHISSLPPKRSGQWGQETHRLSVQ